MFKKVRKTEFAFYIVAAVVFLGGLSLVVLGVVAHWWIDSSSIGPNSLLIAEAEWIEKIGINLTFRTMGFIVIAIAAIIAIVNLVVGANYFARQKEREERKLLRKQKIETSLNDNSEDN